MQLAQPVGLCPGVSFELEGGAFLSRTLHHLLAFSAGVPTTSI